MTRRAAVSTVIRVRVCAGYEKLLLSPIAQSKHP